MSSEIMTDEPEPDSPDWTQDHLDSDAQIVDIVVQHPAWSGIAGHQALCRRAVQQVLVSEDADGSGLAILLADDQALQNLNRQFRDIDKPTNVLSFPAVAGPAVALDDDNWIGDIAIAFETVEREALERGIPVSDHLVHMVVHGCLHLLGYDHVDDDEAEQMEPREVQILSSLEIADPYLLRDDM